MQVSKIRLPAYCACSQSIELTAEAVCGASVDTSTLQQEVVRRLLDFLSYDVNSNGECQENFDNNSNNTVPVLDNVHCFKHSFNSIPCYITWWGRKQEGGEWEGRRRDWQESKLVQHERGKRVRKERQASLQKRWERTKNGSWTGVGEEKEQMTKRGS